MPHVSKKSLKKNVAKELAGQFLELLASVENKKEASILANELLSQTERVMLAKRLMIIALLARGYSFSSIEESLGVTPQTVARIWRALKQGKFRKLVSYVRRPHSQETSLVDDFIRLVHIGLPPRAGRNRWKYLIS
jgi:uncharacterized protein YerC